MAKRKFGASVIILCIAAITLISGTYAWFLVGGFANLFDIGFDVIEATGGIELRGDETTSQWKDSLERDDFTMYSFIAQGGSYRPVSSTNGASFLSVVMEDHDFKSNGTPINKTNATDPNDISYNDFTFYVRSTGEELVASEGRGAYMQVKLGGYKAGDNADDPVVEDGVGAAHAARVAVTVDGTTTVYDIDGENYNAVTATFPDNTITDADPYNQIIDGADAGNAAAGLTMVNVTKLTADDDSAIKIRLGNIPGTSSADYNTGKQIRVQIWLEGNDKECVDVGENAVAGKNLLAKLTFGVDE